ncbi:MAG: DMT family transporter [Pseudomonadales bacterium]
MTAQKKMSGVDWGLLLVLSLLFGGSYFFVAIALRDLPPMSVVFLRLAISAIVLWLFIAATHSRLPGDIQLWFSFLVMGLLNNLIPYTLLVWGQTQIASGLAAIFNATTPLFTVIIAGLVLADERITLAKLVGLVLGFTGTMIIFFPSMLGSGNSIWAQLACVGAALSYSSAGVYGRRFARTGISPAVTATGQLTTAAVLLLPAVLFHDQPWQLGMPGLSTWVAVFALAVFSTALAYLIYFRLLANAGATNLLLVTFLAPISAILLGAVFLQEQLRAEHLAGMLVVGLGFVAIDGRIRWRIWPRCTS